MPHFRRDPPRLTEVFVFNVRRWDACWTRMAGGGSWLSGLTGERSGYLRPVNNDDGALP